MGYLYALIATLLWSGNAIAARFLAETEPPVGVAFWRWFVALLVCIPATYPAFRRNIPAVKEHWRYLTLLAFLGVAVFNTLLYTAAHTTTAFNIAVISTVIPVIILVFSFIFAKERLSATGFAGFLLATVGIVSLITDGHPQRLFQMHTVMGDYLMLFAAGVFAAYTVLVRRKPPEITINTMVFYTFTAGFFMLLPMYIVQEVWFEGVTFGIRQVSVFIYIGVFASFVSFMCWNRAVVMIGAARSGAVYYSIPVFTGFLGYMLIGEVVTVVDMFSMAAVGFGVYLTGKK